MCNSIYFTQNVNNNSMPDYFSHYIIADKIYEKLDRKDKSKIENYTLYLLGAQGGDVFFHYNLHFRKSNLGRRLHSKDPQELFTALLEGDLSYAAGFATHYAADSILHPAVYAFAEHSHAMFAHFAFEDDLGLFISRKYSAPRKILPRDKVVGATFTLYDSIKKVEPKITVTGVERCLKRHFSYTRLTYKRKRQTYKFDYDYSTLSGAVEDAVELGVSAVHSILSAQVPADVFSRSFLQK
jgi:hypothetical protein